MNKIISKSLVALAGTSMFVVFALSAKVTLSKTVNTLELKTTPSQSLISQKPSASGDPLGNTRIKPAINNQPVELLPQALVQPKGVLLYCGNGTAVCSEGVSKIKAYYSALGASPVVETTSFPFALSQYRLIYVLAPTQLFNSDQIVALQKFVNRGGRLVVVGEYDGFWGEVGRDAGNSLLAQLGVPITFNADAVDSGCDTWFTANYSSHPLTSNLPAVGLEYAATSSLNLTGGAVKLLGTVTGDQPFAAVYRKRTRGEVVVVGDSNLFGDGCNPNNQQFWRTLFLLKYVLQ